MPAGLFPHCDINVKDMIGNGYTEERIISAILSGNTYTDSYVKKNFSSIIEKFSMRELHWDVKIIDFILEKYKENKVFADISHPTNFVLEKIARGILEVLNLPQESVECKTNFCCWEMPIYPEVRRVLGLKYGDVSELIRKDSPWKLDKDMDMEEYIRQYIYWCGL